MKVEVEINRKTNKPGFSNFNDSVNKGGKIKFYQENNNLDTVVSIDRELSEKEYKKVKNEINKSIKKIRSILIDNLKEE